MAIAIVGGILAFVPIILAEIFGMIGGILAFVGIIGALTWLTGGFFPY